MVSRGGLPTVPTWGHFAKLNNLYVEVALPCMFFQVAMETIIQMHVHEENYLLQKTLAMYLRANELTQYHIWVLKIAGGI